MKKENKWLIIYAVLFTLIAVLFVVGFRSYENEKVLKVYKNYISDVNAFKHEKLDEGLVTRKTTLYKGSEVVGYAYLGSDKVEGIPLTTGPRELRIEVVVNKDKVIVGVRVDYSEHTPDYVEYVRQYFAKLPNTALIDYKKVDEVAGASAKSMPIVREILDQVTVLVTGSEPNPREERDPYKEIFSNKESVEDDDTFVATEQVTKKEIVKDAEGNILGHVYTIVDSTSKDPDDKFKEIPYTGEGILEYLVALDPTNKVVGIYKIRNNHTGSYFGNYSDILEGLNGQDASTITIDTVTDATISGNALTRIFEALKAVL